MGKKKGLFEKPLLILLQIIGAYKVTELVCERHIHQW